MNREFLKKMMWEAHYILKPGTTTSFVLDRFAKIDTLEDRKEKAAATSALIEDNRKEGREMLLPLRVCFTDPSIAPVAYSGRGTRAKVKQMKSYFTKGEESPYKIAKPFRVCTSVWQIPGTRCFYYGTLGITPAKDQKPIDNGDLIVFYTSDWRDVQVFIFKGLAKPNEEANLDQVQAFVENYVIKG